MALEEREDLEGKTNDTKKVEEVKDVDVSPDAMKLIQDLQKQVSKLEKQNSNSVIDGDSNTENLLKMLADKITESKPDKTGQFTFDTHHSESEIDEDDVLSDEEAVTFVTHKMMSIIVDDKRHGRSIKAPFNEIIFKYASTKQIKRGKETEIIQLSTYTCRSKKELAWLKAHSLFNITFFDKIDVALSSDVRRAGRLAKMMVQLGTMGQHALIAMARERGISVSSSDLSEIRGAIAHKIIEEEDSKNEERIKSSLLEQKLEADLINQKVGG